MLAAVIALAGCAAPGPVDNPVGRRLTWFSYVNGDGLRATCTTGAPDRYRLVYNGIYTEEVRAIDLYVRSDGGAEVAVRIKRPPNFLAGLSLTDVFAPWRATVLRAAFAPATVRALTARLAAAGAFGPPPEGLSLNSSRFYWVVAGCHEGRFFFNAYAYPSARFARLGLIDLFERALPKAPPFNRPRALGPPVLPTQCSSRRDPRPECLEPPFLFTVGKHGLVGNLAL